MTFDYQELYHTGIRVPDLDAAMAEIGPAMGVTWAEPVSNPGQSVWTPGDGLQSVPLRFTYSCEGPQHLELLEGAVGSIWDGREFPGVHHQGVWVDDVAAEAARLSAAGWTCAAAGAAPDDGFGSFAYMQPPSGLIIELVNAAIKPLFDRWWAGNAFGT